MANKRASTTPRADHEAEIFRELYKKHEKIDCTTDMWRRAKCRCGCKLHYGMSAYAMHRSGAEVFMLSECGRKIWFNRLDWPIIEEDCKV